jgi:hypothetical protein
VTHPPNEALEILIAPGRAPARDDPPFAATDQPRRDNLRRLFRLSQIALEGLTDRSRRATLRASIRGDLIR